MALFKELKLGLFVCQKLHSESDKCLRFLRLSSSLPLIHTQGEPQTTTERKLIKVAIIGRPNAGKSTLINSILKLNICGVSHKSHTTRALFKTSFTENNTQIVFMDTPGLVTQKEVSRFNLPSSFKRSLGKNVISEVDIIGVIQEVRTPRQLLKLPLGLSQYLNEFSEPKPMFLIINKVDLITDKSELSSVVEMFMNPAEGVNKPKILQNFSRIFLTSAIQSKGVREIVDYLISLAKPSAWLFEADETYNMPLKTLILELLRAHFMDSLPHEVPYYCKYEIEYLKENELGEIICVSLITCRYAKHAALIITKKKKNLRLLCKKLESDLFKILGKTFRIRIVVLPPKNKQT